MDDRYLDVLDGSGRTPRESGAVQLYVESAIQDETNSGMLTVYLQAAFEPFKGGTLSLYAEGTDGSAALPESQTKFPLPELPKGRVVRWLLPLKFRSKAKTLTLEVHAPVAKSAQRVRQPWKVFKAFRAPTTDEIDGISSAPPPPPEERVEPIGGFFAAFGNALSTVFGGGKAEQERPVPIKVEVRSGVPMPMEKDSVEKVWELGEPMPQLQRPPDATASGVAPSTPTQSTSGTEPPKS